MKIAIIGASGFLGSKLMKILSKDQEIIGADIDEDKNISRLDAIDKVKVREFVLTHKPNVIIDTVALTSSLACEKNHELAYKLNYLTAKNIVEVCKEIDAKMVFLSSTYLFDGIKGNYNEEDKLKPLNEYAKTKVLAEEEILKLNWPIILRVDIMYGYNGKDKPNGVFNQILSEKIIELRDPSQIRQPLFVDDVAYVISELINKNQKGIFHVAGSTRIEMFDFLRGLEKLVRDNTKIKIFDKEPEFKIKIPKNATLDISKIQNLGIKTHSFEEGLDILKKQLEKD